MKYHPITEVCEFKGGSQPPKPEWSTTAKNGYIRMLQIRDFTQPGRFPPEYVKLSKKIKTCEKDDVLIGRYGASIGKVLTGLSGTYNVALIKATPNPKILSKKYLLLVLKGPSFQNFILNIGGRAAQAGFNKEDLTNFQLPIPEGTPEESLEAQKRIAHLLSQVEGLIAQRKQSLQDLDSLLKSVFLDMFGDPVRNGKEWPTTKLSELFSIKHGYAFKSEFFKESGPFLLLTPGNFLESGGFRNRGGKQKYFTGEVPPDYILDKDQLLIAMTEQAPGLLGSSILVPESGQWLHNQRLGLICPKVRVCIHFLYHLFNQESIRQRIHSKATGTKVRHTSPTKIEAIEIGYPPIQLQNKFTLISEKIRKIKLKGKDNLLELENLYSALSQKAFKGELNLSKISLPEELAIYEQQNSYSKSQTSPEQEASTPFTLTEEVILSLIGEQALGLDLPVLMLQLEEKLAAQQTESNEDQEQPTLSYDDLKQLIVDLLEKKALTQTFDQKENHVRVHVTAS